MRRIKCLMILLPLFLSLCSCAGSNNTQAQERFETDLNYQTIDTLIKSEIKQTSEIFYENAITDINIIEDGDGIILENDIICCGNAMVKMLPQSDVETLVIDKNVNLLGFVFENRTNLKEIIIEDGCNVEGIVGADFSGCSSVERIYIPNSVKYAFNFNEFSADSLVIYTQKDSIADEIATRQGFPVVHVNSYDDYLNYIKIC